MKITKQTVIMFEEERIRFGVEVALKNFQWLIANELLKGSGVAGVKTTYRRERPALAAAA